MIYSRNYRFGIGFIRHGSKAYQGSNGGVYKYGIHCWKTRSEGIFNIAVVFSRVCSFRLFFPYRKPICECQG